MYPNEDKAETLSALFVGSFDNLYAVKASLELSLRCVRALVVYLTPSTIALRIHILTIAKTF